MRAMREQPRLVVAKALGMLSLVVCSLVLGFLLRGDSGDDEAARSTQLRLVAAERTLRGEAELLRDTRAELAESRVARDRLRARVSATSRSNARLRRGLRASTRRTARLRRDVRASTRRTAQLRRDLRRVRQALARTRERP